ncbi:MAG TPA: outer membrane protein assembly factor BamA [Caulobacteraceae bacterium]
MRRTQYSCAAMTSALALAAAGVLASSVSAQEAAPAAAPAVTSGPAAPAATPADALPATTAPGAAAPAAPVAVVNRIDIQGAERIERATILAYLPITVGDTVDAARLDLAVKTLFQTDLFSDVRVDVEGDALVVRVIENPIINQVVFEGNRALKEDKLREEVTVRPRGVFTRARVEQDVQRIIELYRRSGRISAIVTPKIVQLPQKRVDLVFEISEGPGTGIRRINFLGNQAFSDGDLRDEIVTRQSAFYRFFESNDNYDPDRIEYDREQLRKFYRNRGYYDFRVVSAVAELAPDKNGFVVTYTLDEGPRYRFGDVKVETQLRRLDPKLLQQLLPIRSGEVYSDEKIERATDALTFSAGASGFAFVDIRPRYEANREAKTVDLSFEVREGPRVYIERIEVVGNTQTLDRVIRRELTVGEGDAYNRVLVERSRTQVRNLGFFKDVEITETPGSTPDKVVLLVRVTEQPTGQFNFSIGYSSVDQVIADIGVTQQNFRGRGQILDFRISAGSLRQQVDFSFTEPRFLGRNLAAGLDLYTYKYDFSNQASFSSGSTGALVRLGFPLNSRTRFNPRYTIHADEVEVDDFLCVPDPITGNTLISRSICDQRGTSLTSAVGYSLRWDRRNDYINPTGGFFLDFSQDFAGVGGDVRYIRTQSSSGYYYQIRPKWIVSATQTSGFINGWGGDEIRINDRFFKGGNSFRGFDIAGLGPRDVSFGTEGTALGGKLFAIGSVELAFPTPIPEQYGVKMALFTDFGTLGLLDDPVKRRPDGTIDPNIKDELSLRASVGVSIFWRSPMGPLRFDLSQVLAKEEYDNTQAFRFSTSTRF